MFIYTFNNNNDTLNIKVSCLSMSSVYLNKRATQHIPSLDEIFQKEMERVEEGKGGYLLLLNVVKYKYLCYYCLSISREDASHVSC